MSGFMNEPKIHLSIFEFNWGNDHGKLYLKFESLDGSFATGKPIQVNALMLYPVEQSNPDIFHMYFPNTMALDEYNTLVSVDNWDITETKSGNSSKIRALSPSVENIHHFSGVPPTLTFETVWTQEGFQDGLLAMGEDPWEEVKWEHSTNLVLKDSILMEKIISIQPSEVTLEIKSNNYLIGLTLAIIALTIVTLFASMWMFWFSKSKNNDSKIYSNSDS